MTRLTSLAHVKRYLSITTPGQDVLIDELIPRESGLIERFTSRRFGTVLTHANVRVNGTGSDKLVLPDQPILSVSALSLLATPVPASPGAGMAGYVFDETCIYLIGSKYPYGLKNVTVSYESGYRTSETADIPTGNVPTIEPTDLGFPVADRGVTYEANGAAMTAAASAANLPAGSYYFDAGVYTFNSTESGVGVTMTFDYAPHPVEQACIEMVGLDLKQRDNLGITSKSLAGESISYQGGGMTTSVKEMLNPFRKRTPG